MTGCCRGTSALGASGSRVQCTLQADSPADKHDWLLELQYIKLALGESAYELDPKPNYEAPRRLA